MENKAAGSGSLVAVFEQLKDPRVTDGQRHRLCDILVIALCTVLCGQEEFTAMERFGKAKEAWRRTFLELPFGSPSHDTFRAVLSTLDSKQLAQALIAWTEERAREARPPRDRGPRRQERPARRLQRSQSRPASGQRLGGGQRLVPGAGADE